MICSDYTTLLTDCWDYPKNSYPTIDVIIPFHEKDKQFLQDCLDSILASNVCKLQIHMVADGCLFPDSVYPKFHHQTNYYFTDGNWGPYRIINALVAGNHIGELFAIQDVDDLSHPDRLWKQAACLKDYPMTCCSMVQEPIPPYKGNRHLAEPIIFPGVVYTTTPHGRVVNGTRTIRTSTFKEVNGFADMFCSGDFQFDNRILPLYECHYSMEVLATRRLHVDSISNGREQVYAQMNRVQFTRQLREAVAIMREPTIDKARSLGALCSARTIKKINV